MDMDNSALSGEGSGLFEQAGGWTQGPNEKTHTTENNNKKNKIENKTDEHTLMQGRFGEMPAAVMVNFVLKRITVAGVLRAGGVCKEWRRLRYHPCLVEMFTLTHRLAQ